MSASEENVQDGAAPSGTAGFMNSALQDIYGILIHIERERAGGRGAWVLVIPKILGKCFSGSPSPYKHTYLFLLSLYMNKYIMYS